MAQQSNYKASSASALSAFPSDNASAEAAWRQALLLRELSRDERVVAKKRRAEAESARAQAEHEAITATKQLCAELQTQARLKLQEAEDTLAQSESIKADAETKSARLLNEAAKDLTVARAAREEAEQYAEEVQANARAAADALLNQTRTGAEELASRMRRETAEDIRKILSEIEMARAAAEDELETQRILTETARVRAFSHGLNMEAAPEEMARTNEKPVEFTPAPARAAAPQPAAAPVRKKARPAARKSAKARKAPAKSAARKAA